MRAALGDVDAAFRGQARDAEGREEGVKQGRVVGVSHIFKIELPVVVQDLRGRPQHLRLPVYYPVHPRADQIADVLPQRGYIGRQCPEDEIAELVDAELFQPVLIEVEAVGHPTAPGDTATKGDAVEVAFEIVAPGVIDT